MAPIVEFFLQLQSDMIERGDPVFPVFRQNPKLAAFKIFYFVVVRSVTADGGLLQPKEGCLDNTSHFRSVNLYKEFPYRSESE